MSDRPRIEIEGLAQMVRALKAIDTEATKAMRAVQNAAADVVVDYARPRMPSKTGRARASLKTASSQRESRVSLGGRRAPYAPWLDFGGQGPNGRPALRPFIRKGRYLFPALEVKRAEFIKIMEDGMAELAEAAGLEVER